MLTRNLLALLLLFLIFDIMLMIGVAAGFGVVFLIITQTVSASIGFYQLKKKSLSFNTLFFVDIERKKGIKIVRELWDECLIISGMILLLFPGLLSDIIGYLLMFSSIREKVNRFLL